VAELPPLVVPVDQVARRAGLDADNADVQWQVEQAIRAATADVEAYLRRPVTVRQYVLRHVPPVPARAQGLQVPAPDTGWQLPVQPVVSVDNVVAEYTSDQYATGLFTVTYTAGLDAVADPDLEPIRRRVAAAALADPQLARYVVQVPGARLPRTVSTEGQSITYEARPAVPEAPGGVPPLTTLERWQNRVVYTRQDAPGNPHPGGWRWSEYGDYAGPYDGW
jgi:hypothetical protein